MGHLPLSTGAGFLNHQQEEDFGMILEWIMIVETLSY